MSFYSHGTPSVIGKYVQPFCGYGLPMTVKTAWTKENPGKCFIACTKYHCFVSFIHYGLVLTISFVRLSEWVTLFSSTRAHFLLQLLSALAYLLHDLVFHLNLESVFLSGLLQRMDWLGLLHFCDGIDSLADVVV
ncbi:hypothetical protein CTI12_AA096500 [Artemisia annua]|uniref:Uncharacterized protein n=1 Tax=Artemisia annua TaxID=35608 RepID=A0A2U1PXR7_ARTAN|nr:hypothetical protein CTI12_AA096500 [Artemisia annua]